VDHDGQRKDKQWDFQNAKTKALPLTVVDARRVLDGDFSGLPVTREAILLPILLTEDALLLLLLPCLSMSTTY
jgi:hypothetical protein